MMDDNRIKENLLLYLFFIVSGTLLIISSFALRILNIDSIWVDVLLNVGASLISTAGIAYLYQRFGTNSLSHHLEQLLRSSSIARRAMEFGVREMWRERRDIPNPYWNTFTEVGASEVWLLGMAESGFAHDKKFHKIVSNGTDRGCNYRFLLLDPYSQFSKEVDEKEGKSGLPSSIEGSIRIFMDLQVRNQNKKGKVEIRVYANAPQVSIVRSDDHLLVTPYMYYRVGDESFTLHIHKTLDGIFDHYVEFFEMTWENAQTPKLDSDGDFVRAA
jgi:hypothetical protein